MGVSIEQYRAKIGTFIQRKSRKIIHITRQMNKNASASHLPLLIILCLVSLSITIQFNDEKQCPDITPHGPVQYYRDTPDPGIMKKANNNLGILDNNFQARYKFGNKRKNGLKLSHLNMGSAFLCNKIDEVENVIADYTPHVFGISESNFKVEHNKEDVEITGYQLFLSDTLQNPLLNISRVAVYVHEDVVKPKLRTDLMNDSFSSIWLEVGLKRQKKILICNVYREWQYLGQGDDHSSLTMPEQNRRFVQFLDQWEAAIDTGHEIHVMGDFNNCLLYTSPSPRDS